MSGAFVQGPVGGLSAEAAAAYLGISKRGLERLVAERKLRSCLIGRRRVFRVATLDAFLLERERAGAAAADKAHAVVLNMQQRAGR